MSSELIKRLQFVLFLVSLMRSFVCEDDPSAKFRIDTAIRPNQQIHFGMWLQVHFSEALEVFNLDTFDHGVKFKSLEFKIVYANFLKINRFSLVTSKSG